jgi:hypothetical protein
MQNLHSREGKTCDNPANTTAIDKELFHEEEDLECAKSSFEVGVSITPFLLHIHFGLNLHITSLSLVVHNISYMLLELLHDISLS